MMTDVLVSNVPGRIRVRGARLRVPHGLAGIQRRLQVLPGVVSVQTNARVGSLLMRYDPIRLPPEAAMSRLSDMLDSILPASLGEQARVEGDMAEKAPDEGRTESLTATEWKGWWALRAEAAASAASTSSSSDQREPSKHQLQARLGKINWRKRVNQVAKQGMLLSLGSSLGLVAAGSKKGHLVTGSAFVGLLGVHLAVHRKSLFK